MQEDSKCLLGSSELGLTMITQALNKFGVKRISVKVASIESASTYQILKQITGRLPDRSIESVPLGMESKSVLLERRSVCVSKPAEDRYSSLYSSRVSVKT